MRTGGDVITFCKHEVHDPSINWHRLCLYFARLAFDAPSVPAHRTARLAYLDTRLRHTSDAPEAVPLWWIDEHDASRAGHVAVSAGDGWCYTTDFGGEGEVHLARIADIGPAWNLDFKGWSEDINGGRVFVPSAPKLYRLHVFHGVVNHGSHHGTFATSEAAAFAAVRLANAERFGAITKTKVGTRVIYDVWHRADKQKFGSSNTTFARSADAIPRVRALVNAERGVTVVKEPVAA